MHSLPALASDVDHCLAGRSQTQTEVPVTRFFPGTRSTEANTPPEETNLQQEALL